jgi:hypothetical protein
MREIRAAKDFLTHKMFLIIKKSARNFCEGDLLKRDVLLGE